MAFVLTTQTNPGAAEWSNTSILGSSWVQFTDPGNGGTLNTGTQSGSCVALILQASPAEQCSVAPPQQLGQMLTVSCRFTGPLGPMPFRGGPSRIWLFSSPIDASGIIGVITPASQTNGSFSQFIAQWVNIAGTNTLAWRLVLADGCNIVPAP